MTKQTYAKNPNMTPTSTAPVSTNDKQEKRNCRGHYEEQQKAISNLKRKVEQLKRNIFELEMLDP